MTTAQMTEEFLRKIVETISISERMDEKARKSYQAVGKWLGDGLDKYDVMIMPQGSFNLGTVVKPISEEDDYDIDLVCLLAKGKMLCLTDSEIKNLVGNRLKDNETYKDKLDDEGKRCWTLGYEEFHMDILPCVPKNDIFSKKAHITEIHLTQKIAPSTYVAHYSNPEGYLEWFESRMRDTLLQAKKGSRRFLACADIEKVPTYSVKTPLQMVVQLLKRHRDIMFAHKDDKAPISILVTTLAAKAYNGETSLLETLTNISEHMHEGIICNNNHYFVENPAYSGENFAEKWNEDTNKALAFYEWQNQLKKDIELINEHNLLKNQPWLCRAFGERPVTNGMKAVYPSGPNVITSSARHIEIEHPSRPWGDTF